MWTIIDIYRNKVLAAFDNQAEAKQFRKGYLVSADKRLISFKDIVIMWRGV